MNIAFLSNDADPKMGGVGVVTSILVKSFETKLGAKSFLIYDKTTSRPAIIFEKKLQVTSNSNETIFYDFLKSNNISFIIDQGVVNINRKALRNAANSTSCKIISVIHSKPDLIKVTPSMKSLIWDFGKPGLWKKLIVSLKIIFFPFYKKISNNKFIDWKRDIYDHSDKVVVLSRYYIDNFIKLLKLNTTSKITAIGNPLGFANHYSKNDLHRKINEVLIVSRLSEPDKYLSRIFKVWEIIEKDPFLKDWQLTIVGGGGDEQAYKKIVKKLNLKSVYFEGIQNPVTYYQRSKIFFMSSAHEGLPLTLLEAQQMGLPIVAFDNFESIHELIIEGYNGFTVNSNNISLFAHKAKELMKNDYLRISLAKNAIDHSQNYSTDKIVKSWENLFNELLNEKK